MLVAANQTCHAWHKICAPQLYRKIRVRNHRNVPKLIGDLSKPGSHIAQHTRELWIPRPVPWSDLPKLVRFLPSLDELVTEYYDQPIYPNHPNLSRLSCRVLAASRVVPALTMVTLWKQKLN